MKKVLFASGFACTPAIWRPVEEHLADVAAYRVSWRKADQSVDATRDFLEGEILREKPDAYVGHSLGGLLLLELLIAQRIPQASALIVDAFLEAPADIFKNYVWEDVALREEVTAMLDAQRPDFARLKESIMDWKREGWPEAALETGAHFVYGGRGASEEEVMEALALPHLLIREGQISILPKTSHFLMLEQPQAFAALVRATLGL
ncbi:MAG: alpha/beta fold hydrolase [Myxococcales bacterium]|nr:alpha/beta fold hydrolase [Myxococcales bacterium]